MSPNVLWGEFVFSALIIIIVLKAAGDAGEAILSDARARKTSGVVLNLAELAFYTFVLVIFGFWLQQVLQTLLT